MGEIDVHAQGLGDASMVGEFGAVVEGEGLAQMSWPAPSAQGALERDHDALNLNRAPV